MYICNLQLFGLSNQTLEDCPVEASCQFGISCLCCNLAFLLRRCRNDCFYYFVNKFQPIIIGNLRKTNAKIGFIQLYEVLVGGGGVTGRNARLQGFITCYQSPMNPSLYVITNRLLFIIYFNGSRALPFTWLKIALVF